MKTSDSPIIVEESFDAPAKMVWRAITEVFHMRKWFFDNIPDFKAESGFKTEFVVDSGKGTFLHQWEIVEVIPQKLIKYHWKYAEYPGEAFVTFKLIDEADKVKLRLTNEVLEDFPDEIEEFKRESCQNGWEYFINNSLREYLTVK
jgi:uncharacterized protein YndB with AHSA1/START domain